jgi:tRNA (mo5U34)-methyltransferase
LTNPIDEVLARRWFYEFDLPDGRRTQSYLPAGVEQIHTTRLEMLLSALDPVVRGDWAGHSVIDVACHQGFFASHLARRGAQVLGIDARQEHVRDTECVIETQVVPNMTGVVDWGSYQFQRPLVASFGIIDETAEIHAPEASTTGICVTPSYEALLFLMRKLGFDRVERVSVPTDGYEQLASGKRVMVVGLVDK